MKLLYKSQLPIEESALRVALSEWHAALEQHSQTIGVPAPFPQYEILRGLEQGFVVIDDSQENPEEPKTLDELKDIYTQKIDDSVAEIYQRFCRFQSEYELRESEALAFRENGYAGEVPRQVAAFANRAGLPAQQATDLILSQAAGLRAALAELGDLRMRKYEVMKAQSEGTAQTIFDDIKTLIEQVGASIS